MLRLPQTAGHPFDTTAPYLEPMQAFQTMHGMGRKMKSNRCFLSEHMSIVEPILEALCTASRPHRRLRFARALQEGGNVLLKLFVSIHLSRQEMNCVTIDGRWRSWSNIGNHVEAVM
jgi:hypothetical protein